MSGKPNRFARLRANLATIDNQPLTKASLVIVLFLDLFILGAIFDGLDDHTAQLAAPDDYIPYTCRNMVINGEWNPSNRTTNLSSIILAYSNSSYRIETKKREHHPLCAPYMELLDRIKRDRELVAVFDEHKRVEREATVLQQQIATLKDAYEPSLLEAIAEQREKPPNVEKIGRDFRKKTDALNGLRSRLASLEQTINIHGDITLLWEKLDRLQQAERDGLKSDLRDATFWYPVKKLAMQMIFLLPLFAVLYGWNHTSIKKGRGVQTLVSSHLLVIAFIPIFLKLAETVYQIIPKKLLDTLLELLASLKLIAIWHYLVIAVTVGMALFVIYVFQKKIFSQQRLVERRLTKGQCQHCGKALPPGSQACPFCGFIQFKACRHCGSPTQVFGKYCRECGKAQPVGTDEALAESDQGN